MNFVEGWQAHITGEETSTFCWWPPYRAARFNYFDNRL